MRLNIYFLTGLFSLLGGPLLAQTGGNSVFGFSNLPLSARLNALGGQAVCVHDDDLTPAFQNPALLDESMNNHISFNPVLYIADTRYGFAGYSHSFRHKQDHRKIGSFGLGVQYLNYGTFTYTDNTGEDINTYGLPAASGDPLKSFRASDLCVMVSAARQFRQKFSYGATLKYLSSNYERYSAYALALDIGGNYYDYKKELSAGIVLKNAGTPLRRFIPGEKQPMPFDLEAGISKKLRHTPFCFSLNLHDLQRFNLRYPADNSTQQVLLGDTTAQKTRHYIADKIFLHCIFAAEISLGDHLKIQLSYNHERREELAFTARKSLSGFSFGATIKIKNFQVGYSHAVYNIVSGTNFFTLAVNLGQYLAHHDL